MEETVKLYSFPEEMTELKGNYKPTQHIRKIFFSVHIMLCYKGIQQNYRTNRE